MPYIPPQVWGDPSYMFGVSQELVNLAQDYIAALEAQAGQLVPPVINVNFPTVSAPPIPGQTPEPTLEQVTWTVPGQPPPFSGNVDVSGLIIPPFTGVAPILIFGTGPPPFSGTEPDAPVTNLDFTYPTVAVTLPLPPSLMSIDDVNFPK